MRLKCFVGVASMVMLASVAGVQAQGGAMAENPTVVSVNGESIQAAEVSLLMGEMAAQAQRMGQQVNQQQLSQMAIQRIIDGTLLAQEASRLGFEPDEARVQAAVDQMAQRAGGREKLAELLSRGGASVDVIEKTLRKNELGRQLGEKLGEDIVVTDEEAKAYYEDHPESFTNPEQVHARHILFTVDEGAGEGAKKAARERAVKARERALAGEDFVELAAELSEGPSAKNGGDLGYFSREQMVEPFGEAAFSLEAGEISDVVKTQFGYHVIKSLDHRPAGQQEFSEVKEQLKERLKDQQIGEKVQKLLEELREKADIQQMSGPGSGPSPQSQG